MIAIFILFLVLALTLIVGGIFTYKNAEEDLGLMLSVLGLFVLVLSIILFSIYSSNKAKVTALVESGKYEVVTHDDYSLNELKQFKNIGGVYLKEAEQ